MVYMSACVCSFNVLYYCPTEERKWTISSEYEIKQADVTDWVTFRSSNLIQKLTLIQKPSAKLTKTFH